MFVNNQHGIQQRGQDCYKTFVFEGVHSREIDKGMSCEKLDKAWCYNNLLRKLYDTDTVDRLPGSGRPHSEKLCLLFRRQVRSRSQTCSELEFGLSSSSHELEGLRPASDLSATRFEQVRAISTCRDSSNLVAHRFAAGLSSKSARASQPLTMYFQCIQTAPCFIQSVHFRRSYTLTREHRQNRP